MLRFGAHAEEARVPGEGELAGERVEKRVVHADGAGRQVLFRDVGQNGGIAARGEQARGEGEGLRAVEVGELDALAAQAVHERVVEGGAAAQRRYGQVGENPRRAAGLGHERAGHVEGVAHARHGAVLQ